MRIIGSDRDYYDTGMAWGRDDSVTFLRGGDRRMTERDARVRLGVPDAVCGARLKALDGGSRHGWTERGWDSEHRLKSVETRRVRHIVSHAAAVVAGTLRRGVLIKAAEPYGMSRPVDERWIWTADGLRAYALDHGLEAIEGERDVVAKWRDGDGAGSRTKANRVDVAVLPMDEWFAPHAIAGDARERLVAERVTVAYRDPTEYPPRDAENHLLSWRIDQGGLGEMGFAKALDPYSCFQEIAMWKGGVLGSDGPGTVEIVDDLVKLHKAGFHDPTSFRRAKAAR